MPLQEHFLDFSKQVPSDEVARFLKIADQHCDDFFNTDLHRKMPRFLPADYQFVSKALKEVQNQDILLGDRFCEWGSGIGTATCLASLLGFEATGIEIQGELVRRATKLAADFNLKADFLEMSFLPEGYDFLQTQGGQTLSTPSNSPAVGLNYPDCDWDLEEIDLFYAYPWPEEQEATLSLFEAVAAVDAVFICYFGHGDICIYSKTVD